MTDEELDELLAEVRVSPSVAPAVAVILIDKLRAARQRLAMLELSEQDREALTFARRTLLGFHGGAAACRVLSRLLAASAPGEK